MPIYEVLACCCSTALSRYLEWGPGAVQLAELLPPQSTGAGRVT